MNTYLKSTLLVAGLLVNPGNVTAMDAIKGEGQLIVTINNVFLDKSKLRIRILTPAGREVTEASKVSSRVFDLPTGTYSIQVTCPNGTVKKGTRTVLQKCGDNIRIACSGSGVFFPTSCP